MRHLKFYIPLLFFFTQISISKSQPIPVSEQIPTASSSFLASSKVSNYKPNNICDLSEETAWVEGVEGNGIGEWIAIYIGKYEELKQLNDVEVNILPGYTKSWDSYENNGKPKLIQLDLFLDNKNIGSKLLECPLFEDDEFSDCFGYYCTTSIPVKNIDIPKGTLWLKATIIKAIKGKKYDDTAISEVILKLNIHNFDEMKNTLNILGKAIKEHNNSLIKKLTNMSPEILYKDFNPLENYSNETELSDAGKIIVSSNKNFIFSYPFTECVSRAILFEYNKNKLEIKRISMIKLW